MPISKRRLVEMLANLGNEFAKEDIVKKLNLSSATVRKYLKLLKDGGLIEEISKNRYRITYEAALYLEGISIASKNIGEDKAYIFTDNTGKPMTLKIDSLKKLYIVIKYDLVPKDIIYTHLLNGYLTKWLIESLGAIKLAEKLKNSKDINELLRIIEEYTLITES